MRKLRQIMIGLILPLTVFPQPIAPTQSLSKCEDNFPVLEVKFAHDFNPYIERYHKLTISSAPSSRQSSDAERVFREFMALYRCGCF